MVGQGVLRECLLDDGVESVLAVGRTSTGRTHRKLRELIRKDLFDFSADDTDLQGYDACFFCLGVSVAGMSEADYTRLTFDLTLGWARALAGINPADDVRLCLRRGHRRQSNVGTGEGADRERATRSVPVGVHESVGRVARNARRGLENALDAYCLHRLSAAHGRCYGGRAGSR